MTEKQIEQNANAYYDDLKKNQILSYAPRDFIEGAHSRNDEVKELKRLLNNAVEILKNTYEDDDYFCTRLLDIDEEAKVCERSCNNLKKKCIIRYLKRYKIVK